MALILAGVNIFLVATVGYLHPSPTPLFKRVRIAAFCVGFLAGISGVIAHCIFISWWYSEQQNLITLSIRVGVYGLWQHSHVRHTEPVVLRAHRRLGVRPRVVALFVWTFTSATK